MHRELSSDGNPFERPRAAGLYLLTGLLGLLLLADLWPPFAGWLAGVGLPVPTWTNRELAGFRFAQIAAILGGARILFASLERLAEGKVGADLATAVACIAALAMNEPVVAAEVVVIGLVGECLELWTYSRARRGVERLTEVFPIRCWRLVDGREERTLTADLNVGDTIVVKPGAKIPVDGVVTAGQSSVDLSAITGESLPQERGPGDAVLAGSVNQLGALTIEAIKVAANTVVGRVIATTAEALKNKSPVERQADKLARWFLPALLLLAAVIFLLNLFWVGGPWLPEGKRLSWVLAARQSLYPTLAVLVVACPCALLLATPAAVVAALGRLAGTGVLIRGGAVLERLAGITAIAFDKTGTLTEAKLRVAEIVTFDGFDQTELLRLAAAVELFSEHPIAHCIIAAARERGIAIPPAERFQAQPGLGASATVEGRTVVIGNRRLIEDADVSINSKIAEALHRSETSTLLLIMVGEVRDASESSEMRAAPERISEDSDASRKESFRIVGLLAVQDTIRPEAADVLADLRASGIGGMAILTGDRAGAARPIAEELKIADVHAELLPVQKADWLAAHPDYAFIGDGINDAPAIARAAVGIAIRGPHSDAPADVGDAVFLGEPLEHLPLLLRLSRETVRIIRQNILVFAFGVNLVGVLLVGVFWPLWFGSGELFEKSPLVGVLYHQFGSLAVLLNSMRLLAFERPSTSRAVADWKLKWKDFDGRLERAFDTDYLLHEAAHFWKPIAATLGSLAVILWLLDGLTQIGPDEVGVTKRFGRIVARLEPGLHVRYPAPFEETTVLKPAVPRAVPVGFRIAKPDSPFGVVPRPNAAQTWSSPHEDDLFRISAESLMLTGDGNLIDVLATVRYAISDPVQYINACDDVDTLVQQAFEALLRERLAGEAFLELLTVRRSLLGDELLQALKQRLERIHPDGLGIELLRVELPDLHPPPEVVPAYHDVARAIQGRDQQVNAGEAEATRKRRRAQEDALRALRQAEAAAHERIRRAESDRDAFLAWVQYRTRLTEAEEANVKGQDAARAELLATKRRLTEFRLALDATVAVLKGRDKVLIDADELPGKRNLLFVDPELFKLLPEPKR